MLARALGVDPLRLQDLAWRRLAERVAYGVYRIPLVPPTALDQYMEATLWPQGVEGVLCHETALDLHDLCDVNPAKIHLTVPARYRVRREVPKLYILHHRDLDDPDVTMHEGIPSVTPSGRYSTASRATSVGGSLTRRSRQPWRAGRCGVSSWPT